MKEFKINKYITLRLIGIKHKKTIIYVDDEEFMQCKYLLIINPQEKKIQKEIQSIDEASELLSQDLEKQLKPIDLGITPEEEFWGHCSNLQAWVENDYNVNIIHTNLAFPLLKELAEKGDKKARAKLREVFIKIFEEMDLLKIMKFLVEGYFYFFSFEEFTDLYRTFANISKAKSNIKEIPFYLDLFQSFGGASRTYSEDKKPALKPIIPDIRTFLKKLKIKFDVKDKKIEKILLHKIYVDGTFVTLKELLGKKNINHN